MLLAAIILLMSVGPLRADFAEGLAAFDAGDYAAAAEAWQPLAEAGDLEARVALAELYRTGQGVPIDLDAALALYRGAAEQGDAVAQLNLGDIYSRGDGVPRDLVQAYLWLSLAAAQGRRWPAQRRSEIAEQMTAAEIAEAERLVEARQRQ